MLNFVAQDFMIAEDNVVTQTDLTKSSKLMILIKKIYILWLNYFKRSMASNA